MHNNLCIKAVLVVFWVCVVFHMLSTTTRNNHTYHRWSCNAFTPTTATTCGSQQHLLPRLVGKKKSTTPDTKSYYSFTKNTPFYQKKKYHITTHTFLNMSVSSSSSNKRLKKSPVVVEHWSNRLRNVLDNLPQPLGTFVYSNKQQPTSVVQPAPIAIGTIGNMEFPLSDSTVHELMKVATRVPFGIEEKTTLLDDKIWKSWYIDSTMISIAEDGDKDWTTYFDQIVRRCCYELGISKEQFDSTGIQANLDKMSIYEEGGHFVQYHDTEKDTGMFGTMIIQLPTSIGYTGGVVTITHNGKYQTIDLSMGSEKMFYEMSFYNDCVAQFHPISSGKRVCLVYKLFATSQDIVLSKNKEKSIDTFAYCKQLKHVPSLQPAIAIENFGRIGLPLSHNTIQELIEVSTKETLEVDTETLFDGSIHRIWQIDSSMIQIKSDKRKEWNEYIDDTVRRCCSALGISKDRLKKIGIQANLSKMVIYENGGHFAPQYNDPEIHDCMLGTMMIQLPTCSGFTGGALSVTHNGNCHTLDLSMDSNTNFYEIVSMADTVHELHPITSGKRFCLVYSLVATSPDKYVVREIEQPRGLFVYYKQLNNVPSLQPDINIENVGRIGLPLSNKDINELIEVSSQESFEMKGETLFYDKMHKIDSSMISIAASDEGMEWTQYFDETVRRCCNEIGISNDRFDSYGIQAKLSKIWIFEEGGQFGPHCSSVKQDGVFATMIIQLPTSSGFTGGALSVKHNAKWNTFDLSINSNNKFYEIAFYSGSVYELHPIATGMRVCLVYNLVTTSMKAALLNNAFNMETVEKLRSIWKAWNNDGDEKIYKLGYELCYPNESIDELYYPETDPNYEEPYILSALQIRDWFRPSSLCEEDEIAFSTLMNAKSASGKRLFRVSFLLMEWFQIEVKEPYRNIGKEDRYNPICVLTENPEGFFSLIWNGDIATASKRNELPDSIDSEWNMICNCNDGWWILPDDDCKDGVKVNDINAYYKFQKEDNEFDYRRQMFRRVYFDGTYERKDRENGCTDRWYYSSAMIISPCEM